MRYAKLVSHFVIVLKTSCLFHSYIVVIHTCACACMHTRACVCVCACALACACNHAYACMHACISMCVFVSGGDRHTLHFCHATPLQLIITCLANVEKIQHCISVTSNHEVAIPTFYKAVPSPTKGQVLW